MNRFHPWAPNRRQALGMLGALAAGPAALAAEPGYPSRSLRIVVPYPTAGSTDFVARLLAERLAEQLQQSVVVENKAGAGGIIGSQQIARSAPDGYTIGIGSSTNMAMVPATLREPAYDPVKDFSPLSSIVSMDLVLVTSTRVPATHLAEFVAWASSQAKPVFLATFGAGSSGHFAGFLLAKAAGIRFEPVHYRTVGDAMIALISGEVHALLSTPSLALPHVKADKLRALATNGPTRSAAYPDVPTFKEVGYPDMQFSNWIGVVGPANMPLPILERLNAELVKATHSPAVRARLEDGGYRVIGNSREAFATTIRQDVALWRDVVKTTGFKV